MENLKRIEALIEKSFKGMELAKYANIRNEYENTYFEARIQRAKMLGNIDDAIELTKEYVSILKKRIA